jgi:hypothetical protein
MLQGTALGRSPVLLSLHFKQRTMSDANPTTLLGSSTDKGIYQEQFYIIKKILPLNKSESATAPAFD